MRLTIFLSEEEREALSTVAKAEMRFPRDQVRHIVRKELERRGLLPADELTQGATE